MKLTLLTHTKILGKEISKILNSGKYSNFKIIVAYSRYSGIGRIYNDLVNFLNNKGTISAIVGIDQYQTSYQTLINLKTFTKNKLFVCHHKNFNMTFHPKMYLFGNEKIEKIFIGSSNLTFGGFYSNYEANISVDFNYSGKEEYFQKQISDYWNNLLSDENTKKCDSLLLKTLLKSGKIFDECQQHPFREIIEDVFFEHLPFKSKKRLKNIPHVVESSIHLPKFKDKFAMTLSKFDVSAKSQDPVILIPIKALKMLPVFWNFPTFYTYSNTGYPQFYTTADVYIEGKNLKNQQIRIYYYKSKQEFRLQCNIIKRKGTQGDIILIQKVLGKQLKFYIKLLNSQSKEYKAIKPILTHKVSSQKVFAYF